MANLSLQRKVVLGPKAFVVLPIPSKSFFLFSFRDGRCYGYADVNLALQKAFDHQ